MDRLGPDAEGRQRAAELLLVSGRPCRHSPHGRSGSATNAVHQVSRANDSPRRRTPPRYRPASSTLTEEATRAPHPRVGRPPPAPAVATRPPARSAIASSGRQLSAARSFKASGMSGSGSVRLREVVARPTGGLPAQACKFVAITPPQPRNLRPLFGLRWNFTTIERSSSVSARSRMVAIAFGAQVENRRGLCSPFTSTLRITCAAALVCPELRMPRISSLSLRRCRPHR